MILKNENVCDVVPGCLIYDHLYFDMNVKLYLVVSNTMLQSSHNANTREMTFSCEDEMVVEQCSHWRTFNVIA